MSLRSVTACTATTAMLSLAVVGADGFGTPVDVLTGLSRPGEVAVDPLGHVWFTQLAEPITEHPTTVALERLAPGAPAADTMLTWSGTRPRLTNLQFDGTGNAYFILSRDIETDAGPARAYRIDRRDVGGSTVPLVDTVATGGDRAIGGVTSGSTIDMLELAADGTILFTSRVYDSGLGKQIAQVLALVPGAATPSLVASFAAGAFDLVQSLAVARDGTIYVQELAAGVAAHIYRIRSGSPPELILGVPAGGDSTTPRPMWIGLDGLGNLVVAKRSFVGLVRFGCSEGTTVELVRYAAASLASGTPVGTVFSAVTHPGYLPFFVLSRSLFRATAQGDVLFAIFPSNTRCDTPPPPIRATSLELRGVSAGDATGEQVLLHADVPASPLELVPLIEPHLEGPYGIASDRYHAFYTAARLGTLTRMPLIHSIADLIAAIEALNLTQGVAQSLDAKLANAQKALESHGAGDTTAACNMLEAFMKEVDAQGQTGAVTAYDAEALRAAVDALKTASGCS